MSVCAVEGCDKPRRGLDWCDTHYRRWRRNGDPIKPSAYEQQRGKEECDMGGHNKRDNCACGALKEASARSCMDCYNASRAKSVCSVDGCDRSHYGRGWCKLHYDRWQRHGDPLWTRPKSEPVIKPPKALRPGVCCVESCVRTDRIVRGLCNMHYSRWLDHGTTERLNESRADMTPEERKERHRLANSVSQAVEAVTPAEGANGLSVEVVRTVPCPACGAGSADKCWWQPEGGYLVQRAAIHPGRIERAIEWRAKHWC